MANIFADVGRSNLYAVGTDLMKKAVDVRREAAVGAKEMLGTQMAVQKFNVDMKTAEQESRIRERELEEIEQKRAEENRLIPLESIQYTIGKTGMPSEAMEYGLSIAEENGFLEKKGEKQFIRAKDYASLINLFQTRADFQEQLLTATINGYEQEVRKIQQGFAEGTIKGKDAETAQARLDQLMDPRNGLLTVAYNQQENKMAGVPEGVKMQTQSHLATLTDEEAAEHGWSKGGLYSVILREDGTVGRVLGPPTPKELQDRKGEKKEEEEEPLGVVAKKSLDMLKTKYGTLTKWGWELNPKKMEQYMYLLENLAALEPYYPHPNNLAVAAEKLAEVLAEYSPGVKTDPRTFQAIAKETGISVDILNRVWGP